MSFGNQKDPLNSNIPQQRCRINLTVATARDITEAVTTLKKIKAFWDMTLCLLVVTNLSNQTFASIFRVVQET
jgi:hypothetical protein